MKRTALLINLIVSLAICAPTITHGREQSRTASVAVPDVPYSGSLAICCEGGPWQCAMAIGPADTLTVDIIPTTSKTTEDYWNREVRYCVKRNGTELIQSVVKQESEATGLTIMRDLRSGIRLYAGGGVSVGFPVTEGLVPACGSSVQITPGRGCRLRRLNNNFSTLTKGVLPIVTEEVIDSINTTADVGTDIRGAWNYLDRVMPQGRVALGGRYECNIVDSPLRDGSLLLVYTGGCLDYFPDLWKKGMVKAVLRPTTFAGHYDVEWFDAMMSLLPDECSATYEAWNLLTFSFPMLKSQIRFTRSANLSPTESNSSQ